MQLPLDRFAALEAGDVLFVDTTHVVKRGGEVTRVVLGVLPRLRTGVRASGSVDEVQDSQGNVRDELYTIGAHGYLVYKEQAYGINLGFEPGPAPGLR